MRPRGASWLCVAALSLTPGASAQAGGTPAAQAQAATAPAGAAAIGEIVFTDHRDPPPWRAPSGPAQDQYELGHEVFNTDFLPAGTPNAGRRAGLGPLFNSASCDECHNEGARARGPVGDGVAPQGLVVQLERPAASDGSLASAGRAGSRARDEMTASAADATVGTPQGRASLADLGIAPDGRPEPPGDPVYGRVFNTAALAGVEPEGEVYVHYETVRGQYPDGSGWELREPHYQLTNLRYGPLASTTLIKPRLAPALFGVGLLEAVPVAGSDGRFGWQGSAYSIRDQTTRAFSREMGLTSADRRFDDCTVQESACLKHQGGEAAEVSAPLLDAVVTFQRWLAVPQGPHPVAPQDPGAKLFAQVGCAACHQPLQPVQFRTPDGQLVRSSIAPYTDLKLHYLGSGLSDGDASGERAVSRWRTPALWGLGYRLGRESFPTFLHDGRARSVEEAVLWHDGEAAAARLRFEQLPRAEREALMRWVGAL
ncbi:MAG TPA: di-heme oxidoredictase family protein [Steroidobacteraceae bacterium]|nr:di-heme oxidoredictase family protein [Steroidobacteraceae bacterium]